MKITFHILLTLILLNGCSKSPKCWGDDKNKGIIVKDVNFGSACMIHFVDQKFVIKSQEKLDSLYQAETCSQLKKPSIDFEAYTLLGQYVTAGGCEFKTIKEVEKNEDAKTYKYIVTVKSCGLCKMKMFNMNWILVPKLPDDYTVEFFSDEK